MKHLLCVGAVLIGGALWVAAPAQAARPGAQLAQGGSAGGPTPEKILRKMDSDGDDKISKDEFLGPPGRFAMMDADGDGFLTEEELTAAFSRRGGAARSGGGTPGGAPEIPVIATHVHLLPSIGQGSDREDDWEGAVKNALVGMDKLGIRFAVVMPPPRPHSRGEPANLDGFLEAARKHPDRFAVAGGGDSLNGWINGTPPDKVGERMRRMFRDRAEEIVRRGGIGFGETTALHFSFFDGHPFEQSRPDHPLFLLLADIAAKHGVPIDLHMEAVVKDWAVSDALFKRSPGNPKKVSENIRAFERLLAHNRNAKIIWVHLGMDTTGHRTVALTRRMLRRHPNLYLSITGHQLFTRQNRFLIPGQGIAPEWRDLILEFPDRFMIGTDSFFQPDSPSRRMPQRGHVAIKTIQTPGLPPAVKRMVAYENAQRVFKLNVIKEETTASAATLPHPGPAGENFLSEAEIRRAVAGNTLNFAAPRNGRNLFIYFTGDGRIEIKADGSSAVTKKWFIKKNPMGFALLCRTLKRVGQNHCTRVQATGSPDSLKFMNKKVRYQVSVLKGRQLPK